MQRIVAVYFMVFIVGGTSFVISHLLTEHLLPESK